VLAKNAAIGCSNGGVWSRTLGLVRLDGATGRLSLQRLFSIFPRGTPGIGLLLLRAALGITAVSQGVFCFAEPSGSSSPSPAQWILCFTLIISGAALVLGCLTPVAGLVAGLCFLGMALRWFPWAPTDLRDANSLTLGAVITSVSIALIGPGAFSLDAHLFGRREIVIPPSLHPPES
jgi:uncharacterized membrane protein YphA (DoxX/SURF4 family)